MKNHLNYLKDILIHKKKVFVWCLRLKVPLWQAIVHDLSKFTPEEWFSSVNHYWNKDGSRKRRGIWDKSNYADNQAIFLTKYYHNLRNKHHWTHWIYIVYLEKEIKTIPMEMPEIYVREMVADWFAMNGEKNILGWYINNQAGMIFHPRTWATIEKVMNEIL